MSNLDQAAQQVLQAWDSTVLPVTHNGMLQERMKKLRAALTEPVQEPVAWRLWDEDPQGGGDWRYYDAKDFKNGINPTEYFDGLVPLYTAPPQRKPPTGEEVEQCFRDAGITIKGHRWTIAARNVEAAHGIK